MADRFERVTVHLTKNGHPTGQRFYVILDHVKRVARRYANLPAAERHRVLPVELVESIDPGDPDLYRRLTAKRG